MTLQQSGKISALDIIVEESIHPSDSLGMDTTKSRNLAKRSAGQIAYSDFYGKTSVVPACQDFTTSTVFQIPAFNYMLTIQVWGAGASGGNSNSDRAPAAAGGYSVAKLNGGWLVGYGGQGGQNQLSWRDSRGHYDGYGGAGGNASGGDINITGGAGAAGQAAAPGAGGTSPYGGSGGAGRYPVGENGNFPGGGGGGTGEGSGVGKFSWDCGGGGAGGYAGKTILNGSAYAPPYSTAIIEIGAPGQGVATYGSEKGGDGAAGLCRICWDMGALTALPAGTYLSSFCSGYNLYHVLADGNNGIYNQLIESNSASCGYYPPYTYTIFAAQNGYPLSVVLEVAKLYNTNTDWTQQNAALRSMEVPFWGLYRKPEIDGLKGWIADFYSKGFGLAAELAVDFYYGAVASGEYYTRGNTPYKAFYDGGTLGDFLDPPAGYS